MQVLRFAQNDKRLIINILNSSTCAPSREGCRILVDFTLLTARLKPCPFKTSTRRRILQVAEKKQTSEIRFMRGGSETPVGDSTENPIFRTGQVAGLRIIYIARGNSLRPRSSHCRATRSASIWTRSPRCWIRKPRSRQFLRSRLRFSRLPQAEKASSTGRPASGSGPLLSARKLRGRAPFLVPAASRIRAE